MPNIIIPFTQCPASRRSTTNSLLLKEEIIPITKLIESFGLVISNEIFQETLSSAAEQEKREERWLRDAIRNEHGAGGRAVVGSADTLAALNEKRVRWLLIGPMKGVDFWRCPGCGGCGLGRPQTCPQCGEVTYAQSAANEFTDLAFAGGSRVEFTDDDLAELGGVGALLRW